MTSLIFVQCFLRSISQGNRNKNKNKPMRPNQTYKLLDCKTIKKQRNKEKRKNTTSGKEENNGKLCNQ